MKPSLIPSADISADGSSQKRGFTSLNGFVTIFCLLTGKCLDFAAMCKPCKSCETWEK